jgi:hypothetical protein
MPNELLRFARGYVAIRIEPGFGRSGFSNGRSEAIGFFLRMRAGRAGCARFATGIAVWRDPVVDGPRRRFPACPHGTSRSGGSPHRASAASAEITSLPDDDAAAHLNRRCATILIHRERGGCLRGRLRHTW